MDINIFLKLKEYLSSPLGIFEIISILIIALCFCLVSWSVIVDFIKFDSNDTVKQKRKSIVATGTMFLFFICFYLFIKSLFKANFDINRHGDNSFRVIHQYLGQV
jgi:hypothetical protein